MGQDVKLHLADLLQEERMSSLTDKSA